MSLLNDKSENGWRGILTRHLLLELYRKFGDKLTFSIDFDEDFRSQDQLISLIVNGPHNEFMQRTIRANHYDILNLSPAQLLNNILDAFLHPLDDGFNIDNLIPSLVNETKRIACDQEI